jgi:hypothetical protein
MSATLDTVDAQKIQAFVDRTRAFDVEYAAIVVLQHVTEEVRPSVVSVMLDYGKRMRAFEADLRTLTREEHAALNMALGLN